MSGRAVMTAYDFEQKITESERVAELMKIYHGMTNGKLNDEYV